MRGLLFALQFLTVLPVPASPVPPDALTQGRMALFYPLVGLVVGVLLSLVSVLLTGSGSGMQAAILLACWAAVTGALHLDGLADLADGWVGGQGHRERTLSIMQDPACGPVGVTAVLLLLLLKFAALEELLSRGEWTVLLLAPVIGRAGMLAALRYIPYVREGGLGADQSRLLPPADAALVLLAVALLTLLFWGWDGLLPLGLATGCFLLLRRALRARLGGTTGDGIGAICEILEAVVLMGLALTASAA